MKGIVRNTVLVAAILASTLTSAADLTLMSWNTMRMGQGGEKSYPALAAVASKADLVAVQEVMSERGLASFEAALEKQTGEQWSSLASHAVGSKSYKEFYAFLMRDSAVAYEDGAVVYMDRGDRFIREPFSARFKSKRDGSIFAVANIHVLYGDGPQDRAPEIRELARYWTWLEDIYPSTPVMLVGDFNTPPADAAFSALSQYAAPLIIRGASTLSGRDGMYANLYDNIWVSRTLRLKMTSAGIVDYPRMIGWNHEKSRKHVSDHAPVIVTLGSAKAPQGVVYVRPEAARNSAAGLARVFPANQANQQPAPSIASSSPASSGSVRGNAASQIYHRPDCPSYDKIGAKNRVEFASAQEAVAAGYRLAGNCR
ncbi:sunset domain-containing protein [Pseudomonas arcuscaelestis]|uniref:sunset domain-containing protein n=1 Tax=Pseudomonas arcuscaelestis TaxID=2710591 RepID=UPI0038B56FD2